MGHKQWVKVQMGQWVMGHSPVLLTHCLLCQ